MDPASDFLGTVEVPEGNNTEYGQDLGYHRGIPPGRYSVYRFGADAFKLIAPGYGMATDYGNGPLFVRDSEDLVFSQLSQGVDEQHAPTSI